LTENLAAANAQYGVRANAILPGLMNTPMAIEARVAKGTPREEVIASAIGACRCAAGWAPAGTSPTRRSTCTRTRLAS
jgi:NAD(P)-dependent dehydrogenase (short-subunit alcohol dehydrogenase family)